MMTRALDCMGDLYASAIGTTVLQSREIFEMPERFAGELCLFSVHAGIEEVAVRRFFSKFGAVTSVDFAATPPIVRFATHDAARRAAEEADHANICAGVSTRYNQRAYEDRGWCTFEDNVSGELEARLSVNPNLRDALASLPPKMLALRSDADPAPIKAEAGALEGRVERVVAAIESDTFTGKGDKPKVVQLYKDYVERIASALQPLLARQRQSVHATVTLPTMPQVDRPAASPLRYAHGQVLLVRNGASTQLGVVREGGMKATLPFAGAEATVSFDACVQAVVPWRVEADADAVVRDVSALRGVVETARRLGWHAWSPEMATEAEVRALAREVEAVLAPASGAVRAPADAARAALFEAANAAAEAIAQRDRAGHAEGAKTHVEAVARALQQLQSAVRGAHPEALAAAALSASGACGARRYAEGQWLTVRNPSGEWEDVEMASHTLHPWNHAPRELPHNAFEAMRRWWVEATRAQHAHIVDALSGQRLDALQQCVAIDMQGAIALASADAHGLSAWLAAQHAERVQGGVCDAPCAALLTAPPAAGKTTLLSQLVALSLGSAELVPIVIKVQQLQRRLLDEPDAFAAAWNYVDAYLRLEHGDGTLYRFLRQAMAARRAILLIDGLDEGGARRDEIEAHVASCVRWGRDSTDYSCRGDYRARSAATGQRGAGGVQTTESYI